MAKELLLYNTIGDYLAKELISSLEENRNRNVRMRVNSGGGGVMPTWGIAAKISEHGDVTMVVDGMAISSACNLLMYAKDVECLDVSTFLFHRAALDGYGSDTPEAKAFVANANADLRKKMEAKVDSAKLKTLKGVTIAELFESSERINLFLTASDMKQLGIVSKINVLEPSEMKAFNDRMKLVAEWNPEWITKLAAEHNPTNQNSNSMNLAELKEKHPALYAEVIALGVKDGISQESDRIGAIMAFNHIDPKGVKEIIASGKPMTQTQISEFLIKSTSPVFLAKMKAEAAAAVVTETVADGKGTPAANPELEGFVASVKADLGLDKKNEGKGAVLVTLPVV